MPPTSKWLNLESLTNQLLPNREIHLIKYFTANVKFRADDPTQQQRQQIYFRALRTIGHLEICLGRFNSWDRWLPRSNCLKNGHVETSQVVKTEEKGSDVNLATHLLVDGVVGKYDEAWVVSNDSDLLSPVLLGRSELGLNIGTINPQKYKKRVRKLHDPSKGFVQLTVNHVLANQFPDSVKDRKGSFAKPAIW